MPQSMKGTWRRVRICKACGVMTFKEEAGMPCPACDARSFEFEETWVIVALNPPTTTKKL